MNTFAPKTFTHNGKDYYKVGGIAISKRVGDQIGLPEAQSKDIALTTLRDHIFKQTEARKELIRKGYTYEEILSECKIHGCLYEITV